MNLYVYVGGNPVNGIDPYRLYSWLKFGDDVSNFSAGFGDAITFGGTKWMRNKISNELVGFDAPVDKCGTAYGAGELGGYAWFAGTGAGITGAAGRRLQVEVYVLSKGNVFKLLSKKVKMGFRADLAHYGKRWGHLHFWKW